MKSVRPFRVLLVNICEDACGYGPGSSEYLRAQLLAATDLSERVTVDILFSIGETQERIAERILAADPDLVGFTCFSWNIKDTGEVCRLLRRRAVSFPIVWGGCSFSLFAERNEWFRWWDCVDAVAVGSGEVTIVELVRDLVSRGARALDRPLPGLVVNRAGSLEWGPKAQNPKNIDDIASPYLLGVQHKAEHPFIEMARGCRFECGFCSDARSSRDGMWRAYSVDRIAAEVREVLTWPRIEFLDAGASTANISDDDFADVCRALRAGDPERRAAYSFQMYPGLARPAQRASLERIRIDKLCFGVQSTTPETWGPIRRKTTLDHLRRALDVFGGVGPLQASLLLGTPGETLESFKKTFREVAAMGWIICVNRLLVLPGTQIHRDSERLGLRFDEDRYYRITETPTMSPDDMARAQDFIHEAAVALPDQEVNRRYPRVMYTNFDRQETMFSPTAFREERRPPRRN